MIVFATVARRCNISISHRGSPEKRVRLTPGFYRRTVRAQTYGMTAVAWFEYPLSSDWLFTAVAT